jgi:hypothetical protein
MARRLIAFIPLYLLCWNVQALDARQDSGVALSGDARTPEQVLKQKRRENLREATKLPVENAAPAARQLSPQEKWELRQQLRQQRQDFPK